MFQKTLTPPPPKSPSQLTFLFIPNATMNYKTADDATMNVIIWIHVFPYFVVTPAGRRVFALFTQAAAKMVNQWPTEITCTRIDP